MSQPDDIWRRLTTAARRVPMGDEAAPYGFASRVVARALGVRRGPSLLEQLSLRALSVAGIAAVVALVAHLSVPASVASSTDESMFSLEDPAAIVLGVTANE